MKTLKELKKEFEKKVKDDFWGMCCDNCGGGGSNGVLGDGFVKCEKCDGSGIIDWKVDPLWNWMEQAIKEAREYERALIIRRINKLRISDNDTLHQTILKNIPEKKKTIYKKMVYKHNRALRLARCAVYNSSTYKDRIKKNYKKTLSQQEV